MYQTSKLAQVEFITTSTGKPKAVVINISDWKRIVETLKIMSSKELRQSINQAKVELQSDAKLYNLQETFNL